MKKKVIVFIVILVTWTSIVIRCNSEHSQARSGVIFSTLGKIVDLENCLLQGVFQPFSVTASVQSGCYNDSQVVNLATSLPISAVYYTLDGTEPAQGCACQDCIMVCDTQTLRFMAVNLLTGAKTSISSETYLLPSMVDRMILAKETVEPVLIQEIKAEVNKLDQNVLKRLFTQNVKFKFINSFAAEPKLRGFFIPKQALALYYEQTIYVLEDHLQFDGMISTYLHELGHAYDYNDRTDGQMLSEQSAFQRYWQAESLALLPDMDYFNCSSVETFAQCFALYYYSNCTRQLLQQKAPHIYSYLESVTKDHS